MNYQELPTELLPYKDKFLSSEKPYVKIKAEVPRSTLGATQSKFGGVPFLLDSDAYPKTKEGKKLIHLAQLNFSEMPKLEGFPTVGILQFFVNDNDIIGLNLNNQTLQDTFRVLYFSGETVNEEKAITDYDWPKPEKYFVLNRDFALNFSLQQAPISPNDYRFDETLKMEEPIWDMPNKAGDWYWNNCENIGHKVGGYPFFTQDDPRFSKEYRDYTTLLFQMDTDFDKEAKSYKVIWGDCGVANFFIKPESLAKLDFSDVLYNWDCS